MNVAVGLSALQLRHDVFGFSNVFGQVVDNSCAVYEGVHLDYEITQKNIMSDTRVRLAIKLQFHVCECVGHVFSTFNHSSDGLTPFVFL